MRKNLFLATLSLAALGCSTVDGSALPRQTHSYIVGVDISGSRTPTEMAESKQAPFPPKLTVTPPSEIPVQWIKVPAGFHVELWAHGLAGARAMTRGRKGKIYVGTRQRHCVGRPALCLLLDEYAGERVFRTRVVFDLFFETGLVSVDGLVRVSGFVRRNARGGHAGCCCEAISPFSGERRRRQKFLQSGST